MALNNRFVYFPGGEEENAANAAPDNENESTQSEQKPGLLQKIKQALQDWSNDDERQTQEDDTRV